MIKIKYNLNKIPTKQINIDDNLEYNIIILQMFNKLIDLLKKLNKIETDKKQKTINNFRIKNLINAVTVLSGLDYEITLDNINDLKLPGIGKGTISRIVEILENDNLEEIDELEKMTKSKNIDIITELNNVVGIGDKTALELIKKYKIQSISELIDKVNSGKIIVNDKIKLGLKYYGSYKTNIPRDEINKIFIYMEQKLKKFNDKLLFIICGSYRRGKITSGDIDLLLLHEDIYYQEDVPNIHYLTDVVNLFKMDNFFLDDLTETEGGTKYMGFCKYMNNPVRRIDIRMIGIESFFPALVYFTGSYELNQKMRKIAKTLGYKLNEYGLYDESDKKYTILSEEMLFEILGMEYIEPTDRSI
jgi:DNA polymerase/3'-5' exonuclease PolX